MWCAGSSCRPPAARLRQSPRAGGAVGEQGHRVVVAGGHRDGCAEPGHLDRRQRVGQRPVADLAVRVVTPRPHVAVGGEGMYEARCRSCFVPHADAPTIHPD